MVKLSKRKGIFWAITLLDDRNSEDIKRKNSSCFLTNGVCIAIAFL